MGCVWDVMVVQARNNTSNSGPRDVRKPPIPARIIEADLGEVGGEVDKEEGGIEKEPEIDADSSRECECEGRCQEKWRIQRWINIQQEEIEDWLRELEEKEMEEERRLDRIRNYQMWENLSYNLMYLLRDDLPFRRNTKIEPGGWIKVDVLRVCGFRITPTAAKALGGGRGAGKRLRFATKTETERGRKRTRIRVVTAIIHLAPIDFGRENDGVLKGLSRRALWRKKKEENAKYIPKTSYYTLEQEEEEKLREQRR